MLNHPNRQPNHPRMQRIRAAAERMQATLPQPTEPAPQAIIPAHPLVNDLLSDPSAKPDAVRLLRQILRERAISQEIKDWDANNLFG